LVAEVAGGGRRPASLAVRAGSYRVTRRRDGRAAVATVGLAVGTTRSLEEGELREQPTELAMAKGVRRKRHAVFLDGAFVYAQTGAIPTALEAGLSYSYVLPRWQLLGRVAYGGGESSYEEYQVTRTSAQAALLRRLPLATIELAAGLEGGVAHFEQTRQGREDLLPRVPDHLQGTAASAHAVLVVDIPLGGPMSLALGWRGGAILLRGNDALRVRAELLTNIAVGAHF